MSAKMTDRLSRLEARSAPPTAGKHLVFQVEAPGGTATAEIVAHLRERGHTIHDEDEVLVMNLGAYRMAESEPIRDLSADVLTEEARAAASAAGKWPKGLGPFTFTLDTQRVLQ